MRVGIDAYGSWPGGGGGVDVFTHELVRALSRNRGRNDYLVFVEADRQLEWQEVAGSGAVSVVPIRWSETPRRFPIRLRRRLLDSLGIESPPNSGPVYVAQQVDETGIQVFHSPRTVINTPSQVAAHVLTFWDMQHVYYPEFFTEPETRFRLERYQSSVEMADLIVVPSSFTRSSLSEEYGVPVSKMRLVPPCIGEGRGRAPLERVDEVRRKYGLPSEYLFYPANPWPHKNHARLIAALKLCCDRKGRRLQLVCSGRLPNERRDIESLAIAAGIPEQVRDLGFVPEGDLPALYSGALAMVFPSLFEGFGIPLVEAMACGCPILASSCTSIPECVGDAAFLVSATDPESIANGLIRLADSETLRDQLRDAGYERAKLFREERFVREMEAVYEEAADLARVRAT